VGEKKIKKHKNMTKSIIVVQEKLRLKIEKTKHKKEDKAQ